MKSATLNARKRLLPACVWSVLAGCGVAGESASAQSSVQSMLVAATGQQAPGLSSGVVFVQVGAPQVNSLNQVLLSGTVQTPSGIRGGLWLGSPGALNLLALEGTNVPGMPLNVFFATGSAFQTLVLTESGDVLILARIAGPGVPSSSNQIILHYRNGTWTQVARTGTAAPGVPGAINEGFGPPLMNESGKVTLTATVTGPSLPLSNGHWVGTTAGLSNVALSEAAVPGFAGLVFPWPLDNNGLTPGVDSAGRIVFRSWLSGAGVTEVNNGAIWRGSPAGLELVAREGTLPPGVSLGVRWGRDPGNPFEAPVVNQQGDIAFRASLQGAFVTIWNDAGIWCGQPGALSMVTREGETAPGTEVQFETLFDPVLNRNGDIAFRAGLTGAGVTGTNNTGIWYGPRSKLELAAREGDPAPGPGPGYVFTGIEKDAVINARGEMAFVAGAEFGSTQLGEALWVGKPGDLRYVVGQGDELEIAPGVVWSVGRVRILDDVATGNSGGDDHRPRSLSNDGRLGYLALFGKGSAAFVTAPIPNPGDVNGDGICNAADLSVLLAEFGASGDLASDLNDDGSVNSADLSVLLSQFQ